MGFEAIGGGGIEVVQVPDHLQHNLLCLVRIKRSIRGSGRGYGFRLRQGGVETVDEIFQNRAEILQPRVPARRNRLFAAMAFSSVAATCCTAPDAEAASYALNCVGQRVPPAALRSAPAPRRFARALTLLVHELAQQFEIKLPVACHATKAILHVEAFQRRKIG